MIRQSRKIPHKNVASHASIKHLKSTNIDVRLMMYRLMFCTNTASNSGKIRLSAQGVTFPRRKSTAAENWKTNQPQSNAFCAKNRNFNYLLPNHLRLTGVTGCPSGYSNALALAPNVRYDSCCSFGYQSMSFCEMFTELGNLLPSSASKCLLLQLLSIAVKALRKIWCTLLKKKGI